MPRFSSITTGAVIGISNSTGDPFLTPLYNVSYGEVVDDNFGYDVVTNGNFILVADQSGPNQSFKVKLLNAKTGEQIYNIDDPVATASNEFNRLALTNKYFIVGDPGFQGPSSENDRGKVYYYRIDTGELRNAIQLPNGFWNADDRLGDAVAANDRYLVVSVPGANKTYVFDIESGTNTAPGLPTNGIDDATSNSVHKCLSIHDNYLAIGGRIYSTSDWSLIRTIVDSSNNTVMSNGYLAHYVSGSPSRVDIYAVETGELLYSLVAPNGGAGFGSKMAINDSVIAIYQTSITDIFVYDLFSGTLIDQITSSKDTGVGQFGYQISLSNRYLVITDALDDDSGVLNKGRIYTYATKRKSTRWGIDIDRVESVDEGQNINISFTAASDIPDGSIVNYSIVGAGLNPKDVGEIVTAQIPVTRRRGTLTIPIFDDSTTEGTERINVTVSTSAGVPLLERTLTINDTSTTPTDSFVRYIEPPPEALDLLPGATTEFGVDGIASNSGYLFIGVGNGNPNFEQNRSKGLVLVYDISNFELLQVIRPTEPSASLSDQFGTAIACTEDHVIIGARGGFYAETWQLINGRWQFKWRVTEGGGTGSFGIAVDINDTYAIVGAPYNILPGVNPGKVSVYNVSTGSKRGDIRNPDIQSDYFGFSVAITADGTTAYVGAPVAENTNEAANHGKVWLINLSLATAGSSESPVDYTDIISRSNQQFGYSIAIDGLGEFIATPGHITTGTDVVGGGIYRSNLRNALPAEIYDDGNVLGMLTNDDTILGLKAHNGYLLAHGGPRSFLIWWKGTERFLEEYSLRSGPQSATISDRYVILGDTDNRRVAVYRLRSPFGTLVQPPQQKLDFRFVINPQDGLTGSIADDYHAENVTSAVVPNIGKMMAVSAPGEDLSGTSDGRGFIRIYKFDQSQGEFIRLNSIGPPTALDANPSGDAFGEYIVSNSRRLVVGHRLSDSGVTSGGAIYGYTWNDSAGGMALPTYTINNPGNGLFWGQRISISEQYLVVGNPTYDSGVLTSEIDNGRVYVYDALSGTELYQIPSPSQTNSFQFGGAVAVSDSGYLAVGVPTFNGGAGKVYVYRLGESSATLLYELNGTAADQFGTWLKITDNYLMICNEPTNNISGRVAIYRVADGVLLHNPFYATINAILGESSLDNITRLGSFGRTRSPVALSDQYFAVGFVRAQKYTDGVVLVWNVVSGELVSVIGNPDPYPLYVPVTAFNRSLFGGAVDLLENQLLVGAVGERLFNSGGNNVGLLWIFDLP